MKNRGRQGFFSGLEIEFSLNIAPAKQAWKTPLFNHGSSNMFTYYLARFRAQMHAASADRQILTGPQISKITMILSGLVAFYIALAVVLVPPGESREFNFIDERGAITALSAIFLAMGCGFAFVSFLLSCDSSQRTRCFWFLMTVAIGFLGLDELLEFHERVGDRMDRFDLLLIAARQISPTTNISQGELRASVVRPRLISGAGVNRTHKCRFHSRLE